MLKICARFLLLQVMMDDDAGLVRDCPSCGVKECMYSCMTIFICSYVCMYVCMQTCKLCGEESHIPLRCNEVEKKSDTDRRTKLEEAMTKARSGLHSSIYF